MDKNSDLFNLLRKISFKSSLSQRELARDLGFSLGKLNYCVRALNQKGVIKIQHLKKMYKELPQNIYSVF